MARYQSDDRQMARSRCAASLRKHRSSPAPAVFVRPQWLSHVVAARWPERMGCLRGTSPWRCCGWSSAGIASLRGPMDGTRACRPCACIRRWLPAVSVPCERRVRIQQRYSHAWSRSSGRSIHLRGAVVHVGQRECPPVLPSGKSGWLSKSLTIDGKAVVHCPNGPSLFDEAALRSAGRIRMRLAVKRLSKIGRSRFPARIARARRPPITSRRC